MNARLLSVVLPLALAVSLPAAEETPAAPASPAPAAASEPTTTSQATRDAIRARLREDAKRQAATPPKSTAAKPAPAPGPTPAPTTSAASSATTPHPTTAPTPPESVPAILAKAPAPAPTTTSPAPKPAGDATVLPKVEVRQAKPTEVANQLYEQEKLIAREKQLTKSSELDKALNNPKLSIGGDSTASRTSMASERVALLEAEKDLIEQIAMAKTKEQKATLQKELTELKKIRRELEQSVR